MIDIANNQVNNFGGDTSSDDGYRVAELKLGNKFSFNPDSSAVLA